MKKLALLTILGLIASTQSFSQVRGSIGNHGGYDGWDNQYDSYDYDDTYDSHSNRRGKKKIQIPLNQHLRGNNIIKLKKEIKALHPYMDLQNSKLVAVKLVAKSKKGGGEASLIVGQDIGYPQTIGGYPEDFHYEADYTYDKIRLENSSMSSRGKWQIELQGNIKVKKVVVILKEKRSMNRQLRIPMYDQHLRGGNVLKIKQLIKRNNPGIDLSTKKIKMVTLIAKSQRGRGEATLIANGVPSYPETIVGRPRAFESNSMHTYSTVNLANTSHSAQGRVQVELQGNIKVKEILVTLENNNRGRYDVPTRPVRRYRR